LNGIFKKKFILHRMHEMQTVVTNVRNVSSLVARLYSAAHALYAAQSSQPLPNYFGLFLNLLLNNVKELRAVLLLTKNSKGLHIICLKYANC